MFVIKYFDDSICCKRFSQFDNSVGLIILLSIINLMFKFYYINKYNTTVL